MNRLLLLLMLYLTALLTVEAQLVDLPSRYDMREKNLLPAVRSQGQNGTCWIFGSVGAIESNLIQKGLSDEFIDLSEKQLVYFAKTRNTDSGDGNDEGDPFTTGGNNDLAVKALAAHMGPTTETQCPYEDFATPPAEALRYEANVLLHSAYEISISNRDAVKTAVMKYGAQSVGLKMYTASYLNGSAYYNYGNTGGMHFVDIVGWDDEYATTHFREGNQPSQPGAWIARNSWGSNWADGGYFYISYEDPSLTSCFTFNMLPADAEEHYYQYDGRGWNQWQQFEAVANVFTANQDEWLHEVGVFNAGSTSATFRVYVFDAEASVTSPEDGTLCAEMTVAMNAWYSRFALPTPVELKKGQKFAIVQTVDNNNFPVEQKLTDEQLAAGNKDNTAHEGETLLKKSGQWTDCMNTSTTRNACIKAFTRNSCRPATYTVTFAAQADGVDNLPEAQQVAYMATAAEPDVTPTRPGYVFAGWYRDMECSRPWLFDSHVVTDNTTLYAAWSSLTVESIELPQCVVLPKGQSKKIDYTILPETAADAVIEWSSSNAAVVAVAADGTVTAGSTAGEAIITARCGDAVASLRVVVPTYTFDLSYDVNIVAGGIFYIHGNGVETDHTFQLHKSGDYTLYLDGVRIVKEQPTGAGGIFDCSAATNVTIYVMGDNYLKNTSTENNAPAGHGFSSPLDGSITFKGDGTLTAIGGSGGAGIHVGQNCEMTVDMEGGQLNAYGSTTYWHYAAGIGGSNNGSPYDYPKSVVIRSGNVYAQGGLASAGIGARYNAQPAEGFLQIYGGNVYARGGDYCTENWFGGGFQKSQVKPQNAAGEELTTVKVSLGSALKNTPVDAVSVYTAGKSVDYGNGMKTDGNGDLYLLLPQSLHGIHLSAGGQERYYTATPTGVMQTEASAAQFTPGITPSAAAVRYDEAFTLTPEAALYTDYMLNASEGDRLVTANMNGPQATIPLVGEYVATATGKHSETGLPVTFPGFSLKVYNQVDGSICRATQSDPLHITSNEEWAGMAASLASPADVPCQGVLLNENSYLALDTDITEGEATSTTNLVGHLDGQGHVISGLSTQLFAANEGQLTQVGLLQPGVSFCHTNNGVILHSFAKAEPVSGTQTGCLENVYTATDEELASGAIAYQLTAGSSMVWGQRLGEDTHPVPFTVHNRVYAASVYPGNAAAETQYFNADGNGLSIEGNALAYTQGLQLDMPNVVCDGTCSLLALSDRKPLYIPTSFHAQRATYQRTMPAAADWGTGILPFTINCDGLYTLSEIEENVLYASTTTEIEAGKPFLFRTQEDVFDVDVTDVEVCTTVVQPEEKTLAGYQLCGTYQPVTLDAGSYFIYNDMFYCVDSEVSCLPFRAYVSAGINSYAPALYIATDTTTAVNHASDKNTAAPPVFTIDGRRISPAACCTTPGVYIINGRKVYLK